MYSLWAISYCYVDECCWCLSCWSYSSSIALCVDYIFAVRCSMLLCSSLDTLFWWTWPLLKSPTYSHFFVTSSQIILLLLLCVHIKPTVQPTTGYHPATGRSGRPAAPPHHNWWRFEMRNAPEQFSDDDLSCCYTNHQGSRVSSSSPWWGLFSRTVDEQQIKSTVIIIFPAQTILYRQQQSNKKNNSSTYITWAGKSWFDFLFLSSSFLLICHSYITAII